MAKLLIFRLVLLLVPLLVLVQTCKSSDECIRSPSSCGHIPIISYPFRLTTDPINCGNKRYEISCVDNVPLLYYQSEKYHVRSINYKNFTIRLSDASLIPDTNHSTFSCNGSPAVSSAGTDFIKYSPLDTSNHNLYQSLVIINCLDPIPNATLRSYSRYANGTICSDKYNYSTSVLSSNYYHRYARVGSTRVEDLVDSCLVELILLTSMPPAGGRGNVLSYKDVYDSWEYGFKLSWFFHACLFDVPAEDENPCYYLIHERSSGFLFPLLSKLNKFATGHLLAKFGWYRLPYAHRLSEKTLSYCSRLFFNKCPCKVNKSTPDKSCSCQEARKRWLPGKATYHRAGPYRCRWKYK